MTENMNKIKTLTCYCQSIKLEIPQQMTDIKTALDVENYMHHKEIGNEVYLNCSLVGLTINKMKGKQTGDMLSRSSHCSFYRPPIFPEKGMKS